MEELPPGFRFYPTEEELISFYLQNKLEGNRPELSRVVPIVDIYIHEPWELPRLAGERCSGETEQWFFFMAQQEREARGGKPNRTTASGYWKATGSPGYVFSSTQKRVIGVKKTMVFYKGRAPTGRKTKWKMNEYKAIHIDMDAPQTSSSNNSNSPMTIPKLRHEMSLCRVYITSGSSRAFDRRPSAIAIRNVIHQAPGSAELVTLAAASTSGATDTINAGPAEKMASSSTDSSNSGGDGRIHRQRDPAGAGTSNVSHDMISELEPLWEWEQLNWP